MASVADRRRGSEWAMMLWQDWEAEGKIEMLDGPWALDIKAARAAKKEKADPVAFGEAARKAWLRAQKAWRKDRWW